MREPEYHTFIITSYGLDGPGFECWLEKEIFSPLKPIRLALGPTHPFIQWVPRFFVMGKAARV